MYTKESFKADLMWGLFNGSLFSSSYGFVNGSYAAYNKDITKAQYLKGISIYMGKSWIYLTPFFTIGTYN